MLHKHAHKPELDEMTPAMIRVVAEFLLYTMDIEQRTKLIAELPGIYKLIYPEKKSEWMTLEQAKKEGLPCGPN